MVSLRVFGKTESFDFLQSNFSERNISLCSENFPRLEKFPFDGGAREILAKTRERKQMATTTFLVMRYFLPAELAFMIAEETAFGKGTGTLPFEIPQKTSLVTKVLKMKKLL